MTEQPEATVTQLHPDAPDVDDHVIGAHELTIAAGITYRQLDYWTRLGYLTPWNSPTPGSGVPRVYPLDQVDVASTMRAVIAAGVTTPMSLVHQTAVDLLAAGEAQLGDFTIRPRHQETA
jgi:hypothetical protein